MTPAEPELEILRRHLSERTAELAAARAQLAHREATQRESAAFFEKSFYDSPALMGINRLSDRKITEANAAFFRAAGYPREEVIGRTTDDLNLWAFPAQRDAFLRQVGELGRVRDFEGALRSKSGEIGHYLIHADILSIGGIPSLLTVATDITDLRRREQVQSATYAISQAVLAGGELPALFAVLHRIVGSLISAKNFYVALLSPDGEELSFPYFVDESTTPPAPRKRGAGLTEYVLHTAKPLRTTADQVTVMLRGDDRYKPTGRPSALWLGAPLIIDGRPIGVIAAQDYHNPEAYTDADLKLLMFVADQAAVAVHRRQIEAAQRDAHASFEKSFSSSPALMLLASAADGKLIAVNAAFERDSGYTKSEAIGRSTLELGLWLDATERDQFFGRIREKGFIRDYKSDFRAKDGSIRTLLLNAELIELGGRQCMLTVGIDVTERHRRDRVQEATYQISRAALAEEKLPALFAEVHRIISRLMPAKNLYVALLNNDGTELSFPYFTDERVAPPPPRAPGNGFTEYILQTGRPAIVSAAELPALLASRGTYQPLEHAAAQRLAAPLIMRGRALGVIALQDYDRADAYGDEELRLLNFVAEQTAVAVQRRQAGEALATAERKYRSIFENALEGLYLSSPDGRFVSANPALARMLGYATPAELLAAINDIPRQIYVQPTRREDFFALIHQSDEVSGFESEVYRKDGTTCWVSESVRVVRNATGEIDHFEGVANDTTQRHEAARALHAAKEAADAASRAKSYFLASVSHELRTPLNGILGYTQILRRDPALRDKQRAGVDVIHESAEHLLALINDVLDLSKIEAGRVELHPADFDLAEFSAGVARVFAPRAREKGVRFETTLAPDLPRWVRGDEQRLRQVVFNLLANAVKFTTEGGVGVVVEKSPRDGGAIRFAITDTGPGITPADLAKLFEPFTQVGHRAGVASSGTGLGLAISRSLVERMGGQLGVESTPGQGSRFWCDVILPATTAAPAATRVNRPVIGYAGPRRRVLVVDDNPANRAVLVDLLTPVGFEVGEVANGENAVTEVARACPDLVLMDLRMPGGMDGLEATRRIRRSVPGPGLRIIAISASAYELDRRECFAAGCDAFVAKPFREEDLWAQIGTVLNLEWQHGDAADATPPFAGVVHPPPPGEATALHDCAAKGDVVGLRQRAEALIARDAKYSPFARTVLDLAARFKMKAIRQFVTPYLP
ncbi:MAG: PAS domain S-box protein [Opitutaceae bacterium]